MNAVDLMKCADLAAHLGHILEVNPVWKDGYAIFDDEPLAMALAIDTGRWKGRACGLLKNQSLATRNCF